MDFFDGDFFATTKLGDEGHAFLNFIKGKRSSKRVESNSIPAKDKSSLVQWEYLGMHKVTKTNLTAVDRVAQKSN